MSALPESNADRKHNQKTSNRRFVFHEQVLKDQKHLTKCAVALAGFIMHEWSTGEGLSFRISLRRAARYLGGTKRERLQEARDLLVQRGHLMAVKEQTGVKGKRNQPGLYFFGNGPAVLGGMAPTVGATSTEARISLSRGSSLSQRDNPDSETTMSQRSLPSKRDKNKRRASKIAVVPDRALPLMRVVVSNDPELPGLSLARCSGSLPRCASW
jgi:hypothetical protein